MVTRRVSEALTAIPRLRFGLPLNQQALGLGYCDLPLVVEPVGGVGISVRFFCYNHGTIKPSRTIASGHFGLWCSRKVELVPLWVD